MSTPAILRALAYVMVGIAILDPSRITQRRMRTPVELRPAGVSRDASRATSVTDIRQRLAQALRDDVVFDSASAPAAVLLVGNAPQAEEIPDSVPVSTIFDDAAAVPAIRITDLVHADRLLPGWSVGITTSLSARGLSGKSTIVTLEENGIELDRLEHTWKRDDDRFDAQLTFVAPSTGSHVVRVVARTTPDDPIQSADAVDSLVIVEDRLLRVLLHEPRPSWAAAFVRRSLEADPAFHISATTRASKGIEVRGGDPPPALSADSLDRFDAVVIGAPEELQAREVEALERFARRRGGAVVFVPDRRPSGPYVDLLPQLLLDEVLVEEPSAVTIDGRKALRGSEFLVARRLADGTEALATLEHGDTTRAVIVAWPHGAGRMILSGALDAWRYRGDADAFARFWRTRLAASAVAAPGRLDVTVTPAVARPGQRVRIRARLRQTDFDDEADTISFPPVAGRLVTPGGDVQRLRLWPSYETGVFEADIEAPPASGWCGVEVTSGQGVRADTVLVVADSARTVVPRDDAMRTIAEVTGGVAVTDADLTALENHLRSLPRRLAGTTIHPSRSLWWAIGFVAALCAEWTIRRNRGQR